MNMPSHPMESEKLSTYAKGDLFEERVYEYLKHELEQGDLWLSPKFSQIFRKKKYYSRDREDFIVFDISIEVKRPELDEPSLIVLIECKHYESTIPVNDIEEFCSKIGQVTGANVKGVFASASAFQAGAFRLAKNKGVAVVRHFDEQGFKWELSRPLLMRALNLTARQCAEIEHGMVEPQFQPSAYTAYASTPIGFTNAWQGVMQDFMHGLKDKLAGLEKLVVRRQPGKERVAFISKTAIEERTQAILEAAGYLGGSVDLHSLIAHEQQISGLIVHFKDESRSALGRISFHPPQINIYTQDRESPTARFTLAHELGHFFLGHGQYLQREEVRPDDLEIVSSSRIPGSDVERLEWQANTFASYLLLPRRALLERFDLIAKIYGIRNRGHGILYVDKQAVNYGNFKLVVGNLSHHFKVSKTAVRLRLAGLGVLVDQLNL
ncbi:ImmA/IrrE family metallo-endopeptidase [Pseudomonas shirazica]|nr:MULTISPECIES: ImmA/IrrE family metallo-endopeptidase [Pseudomonas]MDY4310733.1 ImmA/IrrE family metallo-endopeptidase [Pseudomonas putida]MDY4320561.1 ImmA/IrrE family metallo-endopeptidase [Pseudomonas putida]MDY4353589.1 ImmA/IrrE family metallo-endopeptidase [Pseudomonas putida]WIV26414.1 ImmA/IrrE family metallo-endopeptidase [Pseudomonas sp. M2(2023)]